MEGKIVDLKDKKVLVTGATGFIGAHIVKGLIAKGCKVKGTVRKLDSPQNEELKNLLGDKKNNLTFCEGDLSDETVWKDIVKGCDYVVHVASPVFSNATKNSKKML